MLKRGRIGVSEGKGEAGLKKENLNLLGIISHKNREGVRSRLGTLVKKEGVSSIKWNKLSGEEFFSRLKRILLLY